jgi:hypothetical protein
MILRLTGYRRMASLQAGRVERLPRQSRPDRQVNARE